MHKHFLLDIAVQTYADRQEDNILSAFLLAELQKAVQSQKRGTSPEAETNMVTAAEATVNSGEYNWCF